VRVSVKVRVVAVVVCSGSNSSNGSSGSSRYASGQRAGVNKRTVLGGAELAAELAGRSFGGSAVMERRAGSCCLWVFDGEIGEILQGGDDRDDAMYISTCMRNSEAPN
jgi:hypothetical protein